VVRQKLGKLCNAVLVKFCQVWIYLSYFLVEGLEHNNDLPLRSMPCQIPGATITSRDITQARKLAFWSCNGYRKMHGLSSITYFSCVHPDREKHC